jgi:integrase
VRLTVLGCRGGRRVTRWSTSEPGRTRLHRSQGWATESGRSRQNCFKPAVVAANEAIAKLPKERRPALLPDGLRFYDLRHSCASLLIAQGASIKAVQAQLGHATASITLDTYGHLFPSEMEALADRLEMVRDAALAERPRTQHGPTDNRLGEPAGGMT